MTSSRSLVLALAGVSLFAPSSAFAETTERNAFHVDAEIDPTAYVLNGYSVHVGLGYRAFRLDLGAFAMDVPEFVHGNSGFDYAAHGFGLKLQYFFAGAPRGLFAGIDANLGKGLVRRERTDLARRDTQFSAGVNLGYRIPIAAGLYVTPWLGVGYEFLADDVPLGGEVYEASRLTFFPAIHVGYSVR